MKKHNLHTHTKYSDGILLPEDLVERARQSGLEVLGISDHAFSRKLPEEYQVTLRLKDYLSHLQQFRKCEGIDVKAGIEIDVSKNYGINPQELPFDVLNGFDYALLEYVDTDFEYWGRVGKRPIQEVIDVRKKFLIPVGLAHNDLQGNYGGVESSLAKQLSDNDIFVELNQSESHPSRGVGRNTRESLDYFRHFSPELIDALKVFGVRFVIGTDSHSGNNLVNFQDAAKFVEENKLLYHPIVL